MPWRPADDNMQGKMQSCILKKKNLHYVKQQKKNDKEEICLNVNSIHF